MRRQGWTRVGCRASECFGGQATTDVEPSLVGAGVGASKHPVTRAGDCDDPRWAGGRCAFRAYEYFGWHLFDLSTDSSAAERLVTRRLL
eukprot:6201649-Pleurochrysis_carterae.AAC.4